MRPWLILVLVAGAAHALEGPMDTCTCDVETFLQDIERVGDEDKGLCSFGCLLFECAYKCKLSGIAFLRKAIDAQCSGADKICVSLLCLLIPVLKAIL